MTQLEKYKYIAENWEDESKSVYFFLNSIGRVNCEEKEGGRLCKLYEDAECLGGIDTEEFKELYPEFFV